MVKDSITNDSRWKDLLAKGVSGISFKGLDGRVEPDGTRVIYDGGKGLLAYNGNEWENFEREHDASQWCEAGHNENSMSTLAVYRHILDKNCA
jgi:hypothetical protein